MNEDITVSNKIVFPSGTCLHHLFEQATRSRPNAPALFFDGQSMTYAELNQRADHLASQLVALGVQTEDFVVVCVERSFEMITGIFATLKAGGAYVPIDIDYPKDRLAFMIEDAQAKVILTQRSLLEFLPKTTAQIICLDDINFNESLQSAVRSPQSSQTLAYMIYTSGSTGKPKGVMITHENVCNQLEGQQAIAPAPIGTMMLTCSISFDVSVLTIFWTLLQGAPLVLPKQGEEKDMVKLSETIEKHKVTHILTLPSLYTLLLEQAPPERLQTLRLVNVSGEVCPTSLAQKHEQIVPDCQLYNLYGPTEATVNCTYFTFPKGFSEPKAPIGIPILNYKIFIVDKNMKEVGPEEVGEIYIGGSKPVVGRGYWNRPELTTERFCLPPAPSKGGGDEPPPPLEGAGGRLYKTGDLARWMPDGNIEFLGRSDFQVKFRGYRIELGEIETAIGLHPSVRETVVLLKNEHEVNNQRLVSYLTLHPDASVTVSELRSHLSQHLPEYMLPSHFVFLEKMPLTTNGKFDRKALPEPPNERPELAQPFEAPINDLEKNISGRWQELLQVQPIGRHDKFFELGGNSIQAAKFIGGLMTELEVSIFITTIFDYPTVASYAAFLGKNYPAPVARISKSGKNVMLELSNSGSRLTPTQINNFKTIIPRLTPAGAPRITHHELRITNPLFLLAPPRSGTTLLRVMLAGHPGLFACNELQLLGFQTLKERSAAYTGKFSLWEEGLIRAVMELKNCDANEARSILKSCEEQDFTTTQMFAELQSWIGDRILVDKSPSYVLDPLALEKAETDFENPLYMHLVRHPYSMVRSFEKYHMGQVLYLHPHDYNARQLGELVWLESHRNTVDFLKKVPPQRQYRIVYEDLVKNPEQVMRQMCDTLGIPFHPNLLDPYKNLDAKMTDGIYRDSRSMGDTHFDQQKNINAKKAEDWKGVLTDNFLCKETWELAEKLGYRSISHLTSISSNSDKSTPKPATNNQQSTTNNHQSTDVAIIGMACRFPGANNIEEFWQNLITAKDVSLQITDEDLLAEGLPVRPEGASRPPRRGEPSTPKGRAVHRAYALDHPYAFDAAFFGYHPKEAEMTDPQHRVFLEKAYQALEAAGYNPFTFGGAIGIFGGVARNSWFNNNVATHPDLLADAGGYQEMLASDSTFSISRVAYKLNLRGPAVNIQTACSTGGVAVHLACQSLLSGDSDMVLVGGGRIQSPVLGGYDYVEGGPLSPDGTCRAFDASANGMVQGHGMAMLVLKKLDKAIEDGDHIWAVIKSTAINNDGSDKTGITAPSSKGQAAVISKALEKAGLSADNISFIEAHGTGTFIGDPIEMQGLTEAFGQTTDKKQFCALGSVKTNIGHLDAGACLAGIIKTALALHHETLPPTMHFSTPNPQIDFANSPFFVNATLRKWERGGEVRRAGISSFGLGGTNAHVILEEAPVSAGSRQLAVCSGEPQLLLLSAKTDRALEEMADNLTTFLDKNPGVSLADTAYTLAVGRPHFTKRNVLLISQTQSRIANNPQSLIPNPQFTFMFPGGGAQYVDMARDLFEANPVFRRHVEECFEILEKQHGMFIREVVFPDGFHDVDGSFQDDKHGGPYDVDGSLQDDKKSSANNNQQSTINNQIESPANALASLFTIEYALAKLWQAWGIEPAEMIGHSMGEYTAACISGVMTLEAALGLVTVRGKLFETLPGDGCMLSVALTEEKLRPYLGTGHTISVINKPDSLVVSGTAEVIESLQEHLENDGVDCSKIHIAVAAHSPQIDPILPAFRKYLETVKLSPPKIPFVSNVTGTWITPEEATSVDYWLKHLRQTVRFADGLATLMPQSLVPNPQSQQKNRIFLEVGPGQTLSTFVRAFPTLSASENGSSKPLVLASVRHPKELKNDVEFILRTVAKLWVAGVDFNYETLFASEKRKRIPLPVYPFERKKFFIAPRPVKPVEVSPQQVFSQQIKPAMPETKLSRIEILAAEIRQSLHELSGMEPAAMDGQASFLELGFDSLFLSQAVIRFNQKFKLELSFRMLFEDASTIDALAEYVDSVLPEDMFRLATAPAQNGHFSKNENGIAPPSEIQRPNELQPAFIQNTLPTADNAMLQLLQQQLQLMQQQLALLQGSQQSAVGSQQSAVGSQQLEGAARHPDEERIGTEVTQSLIPHPSSPVKGVTAKLNSYKKITGGEELTGQQQKGLQDFICRYVEKTKKSKELQQRHRQYYADPRSVTGFSKLWKEIVYQIGHESSKGSKIVDVDGNEYVDYVMSYGVALFGHMPDFVEEAVVAAIKKGNSIDLLPAEATDIARIICELTGMDRVTLANTGTEAVLGAVRAARTISGKDKIAVFDTDYHGMIDQFMVRGVQFGDETRTLPSSPGVPIFLVENTLVLDYDDPGVLQKLKAQLHELAAVVIEPVQAQNPHWQHPELIREIRRLTTEAGVALVFDEIINGFRLHQRGAQAWYGVEADLVAYGKSISGGLPLAAVAGKEKYMAAFDGGQWQYGDDSSPDGVITYYAGTFIKNPVSVAAAHAALKEIQRRGPAMQEELNQRTREFATSIREIFLRTKAPFMIQSASSFFMIKTADGNPLSRLFNYFLRYRGVNMRERPCFISTAHTQEDFEKTYIAFEEAIADMFNAGLIEEWKGEDLNSVGSLQSAVSSPQLTVNGTSMGSPLEVRGVPLTEGQQEIFVSNQLSEQASKAYNIATEIRLEGAFDVEKMKACLWALVERHEALRMTFSADGLTQTAIKLERMDDSIPLVDLTFLDEKGREKALQKLHVEEAEHLFDLQNGPLFRFKIVKLKEDLHLVFITVHHIICDGWSLGILTRELGEMFSAGLLNLEDLVNLLQPKQFSQFAIEESDLQQLPVFQKNEKYWLGQFSDTVPVLELPSDFPRPLVKTFPGAVEKISLAPDFVQQLRKAAAKQGTTFYVFMLAAYQAYLSRITGQDDFVVGVAAAGHNLPGNQNLVGHCIGLLPVRSKVDGNGTFKDFLKTVRGQILDAFEHQQYTFGALVKKLKIARNASRNTLVSVAFNLDSPLDNLEFGGLQASTCAIPRHYETFDTFINLKPLGDRVDFEWSFNTDLFKKESIRMRLAEFETFLRGIVEELTSDKTTFQLSKLPLLPDFEKELLTKFGTGEKANFPLHRSLHELFEEQAERTPDKIAVVFESPASEAVTSSHRLTSLSYRELNRRADALAHELMKKGLKPGAFAGLCMERSPDMLVSIYAILKAGAAYVPIDPRNPKERIQLILEDAGCTHLLTQKEVLENLPLFIGETVFVYPKKLNGHTQNGASQNQKSEIRNPNPDSYRGQSPAYVIYTSGSTGTPKGVAIRHENAVNTLFAINRHLKMSEKDKVFSVSSMSFDMSIPDYFLTLATGATLILAGEETKKDGFALREELEKHCPTIMQATPTTWKILLLAGWKGDPNLKAIAGGEGFPKKLAAEMHARCKSVWNGYGPTETTIYATWQLISEKHLAQVPGEFAAIGKPIANVEMAILDKNGEPTPPGIPGELYIGGKGVADGYLNRLELTETLFVKRAASPFYKTGDLVRYLSGGEIEFLGRIDDQVKIRGYRVEPGEIEETMMRFEGIRQAAVKVITDSTDSQRLVGYVVWRNTQANGQSINSKGASNQESKIKNHKSLKEYLRSMLPGYMVPSVFVEMEALPMNTSLKVDRNALPKPDLSGISKAVFAAPTTPAEKMLAGLWQDLLGVEKLSIHDDFFETGGHSLAAVSLMSKIREATGQKLPLTVLFQYPTIQKLAGCLEKSTVFSLPLRGPQSSVLSLTLRDPQFTPSGSAVNKSLIPIRESGDKPPLYLVHGGGLHVLFYQNMVKYMDEDQPVFALQAKGLNEGEEPLDNIEEMAAHYIAEMLEQNPEGPYCLAGYSLGGLIAWEMAKQLKTMGKEVPVLALFDAVAKYEWAENGAGGTWNKRLKKAGFNLSLLLKDPAKTFEYKSHVLKMQFKHLKGKMVMAYRNNETNEIVEGYLPYGKEVYEKSLEAYEKYRLEPLDIHVDLFRAKEQMFYLHDPELYGWDKFAMEGVTVHEIEGNHLTLFDEPHGKEVADALRGRLSEIPVESERG